MKTQQASLQCRRDPGAPPAHPAAPEFDLCVIIPAHNEEGAVGLTVERVRAVLAALPIRHEIILVDDGSKDGTRAAAERTGARVIASPVNRGYGWALKRGIGASRSEYVAILDADGTYPPEVLPALPRTRALGGDGGGRPQHRDEQRAVDPPSRQVGAEQARQFPRPAEDPGPELRTARVPARERWSGSSRCSRTASRSRRRSRCA